MYVDLDSCLYYGFACLFVSVRVTWTLCTRSRWGLSDQRERESVCV